MKKKDYLYMLVLTIIPLFMVFIVKSQHLLFGNSIDWFNQHVTLADALRHAIRSEGTIFPTYLSNLMSGVNIYHFSYYFYYFDCIDAFHIIIFSNPYCLHLLFLNELHLYALSSNLNIPCTFFTLSSGVSTFCNKSK